MDSDSIEVEKLSVSEFIAGWVGGAAGIVVGQPLDTVKIRITTKKSQCGMMKTFRNMIVNEGVFSLWKGTIAPSFGYGLCTAIAFGVYHNLNKLVCLKYGYKRESEIPVRYLLVPAFISGMVSDIATCPAELIKIVLQADSTSTLTNFGVMKKIWNRQGIVGFYQGLVPTLLRDGPAFAGYFCCYEYFRRKWGTGDLATLNAGGIGGIVSWGINYPLDNIKSKIQESAPGKYKGLSDCFRRTVRSEGWKGLYKGFLPCALRAYPVNAVTFWVFEFGLRMYKKYYEKKM